MYDASGRMAVQLGELGASALRLRRPPCGHRRRGEAAFETYIAYFGSYTVDAKAGVIVHHVEASLFPNLMGTDQRRFFVLPATVSP